jgi:hypothetical protein
MDTAKQTGIEQSSRRSGEDWKAYAIDFLESYCQSHKTVFVDDLWNAGLIKPVSPRALGAVMQHAARESWIVEQTDAGCVLARPSSASHGQLKRVWKSTRFRVQVAPGQTDMFNRD